MKLPDLFISENGDFQMNIAGLNILVVDDDQVFNVVFSTKLESISSTYRIKVKTSAQKALNFLKTQEYLPDLIFLDINMPLVNGFEFLDLLKTRRPEVLEYSRVVMITTSVYKTDESKALEHPNVYRFYKKNLDTNELILCLQRVYFEKKRSSSVGYFDPKRNSMKS